MECKKCLLTDDITTIVDGVCDFCRIHEQLEKDAKKYNFNKVFNKISKEKGYQCLIGISGGVDSSYLLHWAITNGLKPLVVHFDNGYNNPIAEENMEKMIMQLEATYIRYSTHQGEYDMLCSAFIHAGVPDADIPNDMAMNGIIMDLAKRYKIKYILNGHDFRSEGSTPLEWTYMDAKYIQSVYRWFTNKELEHFPLQTFKKQILSALRGVKQIRPYYYLNISDDNKKLLLKDLYGWKEYGPKHAENLYTEWVGYEYLPKYFGIDKRRIFLSAQIRSGLITKTGAKEVLKQEYKPIMTFNTFKGKKRDRNHFETYNFKRYKAILWVLAKLKLVPWLFYKKYT